MEGRLREEESKADTYKQFDEQPDFERDRQTTSAMS